MKIQQSQLLLPVFYTITDSLSEVRTSRHHHESEHSASDMTILKLIEVIKKQNNVSGFPFCQFGFLF